MANRGLEVERNRIRHDDRRPKSFVKPVEESRNSNGLCALRHIETPILTK